MKLQLVDIMLCRMRIQQGAFLLLTTSLSLFAQSVGTSPSFEVASIKPAQAKDSPAGFKIQNGRFVGTNVTVRLLVAIANGLQVHQVSGGPDWASSEGFDVEAKAGSNAADRELMTQMLQTLLADRFKLTLHHETRDSTVYALVVGKDGPKIKLSTDQTPGVALGPNGRINIGTGSVVGTAIPLPLFTGLLGQQLGRIVRNDTGMAGRYDIDLRWTPGTAGEDPPEGSSGPSIFTAIQEQLGLKLQSTKGATGMLLIDHVERPSAN